MTQGIWLQLAAKAEALGPATHLTGPHPKPLLTGGETKAVGAGSGDRDLDTRPLSQS